MKVHSTRSLEQISLSNAIINGLAHDGGLYIFDEFKKVEIEKLINKEYSDVAFAVFRNILDEFSDEELKEIINKAYCKENFSDKVVGVTSFDKYSYLELYWGPTAAFKDMALTVLPELLQASKKKNNLNNVTHIVTATSGDTGSATLSGFRNCENIDVTIIYPDNLVSPLQEKQMLYFSNEKNKAFAYFGNFDDCQKEAKYLLNKDPRLSSANSINIGRLIPQIVYYFYAYLKLVENGSIKINEEINVSVPTGNFGDILAGYIAKQMGLPIDTLICACNENKVLHDFIQTGVYDRNRSFVKTYSPSMDILVSSNIERLIYLFFKDTNKVDQLYKDFNENGKIEIKEYKELFKDFDSSVCSNADILNEIKDEYLTHNYLIDPHTATGRHSLKGREDDKHTLILSTASPYKFEEAFKDLGIDLDYSKAPDSIKKVLATATAKTTISKENLEDFISEKD